MGNKVWKRSVWLVAAGLMLGMLPGCSLLRPFGYIDTQGNEAIPAGFSVAGSFVGEYAPVMQLQVSTQLWGFINREGRIVIEPTFLSVRPFSEGLAPVQASGSGDPWIFIDEEGVQVVPGLFGDASVFVGGLAPVQQQDGDKRYGFINKQGEYIIEPQFYLASVFSQDEGLAVVMPEQGSLMGYISTKGGIVIEPQFAYAGTFAEGLATVKMSNVQGRDDWGAINTLGEVVIPCEFGEIGRFSGGLAPACKMDEETKTRLWGFIDAQGQWVIEPQYTSADTFSAEGLAAVNTGTVDKPRWGFVNTDGSVAIEPRFSGAGTFNGGLAPANLG